MMQIVLFVLKMDDATAFALQLQIGVIYCTAICFGEICEMWLKMLYLHIQQCFSTVFVIVEPSICFDICHGTPINKNKKTRIAWK